jgi:hypothetical protein
MNFQSVGFRLALSIAFVWSLVVVYQAYSFWRSEGERYKATYYSESSLTCNDLTPDASAELGWRKTTHEEMRECEDMNQRINDKIQEEERARINDELPGKLLKLIWRRGILPIGALLIFAASWGSVVGLVRKYFTWLKSGSTS